MDLPSLAGALDIFKKLPIWLLIALGAALPALLYCPLFDGLLTTQQEKWVLFFELLIVFTLICQIGSILFSWYSESRVAPTFLLTPNEEQSFWHVARQNDGSDMTQIAVRFTATNLTNDTLYLLRATISKPRIWRGAISEMVLLRALDRDIYGSATLGHYLPGTAVLPGSISFMIKGTPKTKSDNLVITIRVQDDKGNKFPTTIKLRKV